MMIYSWLLNKYCIFDDYGYPLFLKKGVIYLIYH